MTAITNQQALLKQTQNHADIVADFDELTELLKTSGKYRREQIDHIAQLSLRAFHDGIYKYFVAPKYWQNESYKKALIERSLEKNEAVILVGDEEQLAQIPPELQNDQIQTIQLPISKPFLLNYLGNIEKLQRLTASVYEKQKQSDTNLKDVKTILSISRELQGEKDPSKLLNLILEKARQVTKADAGSIYTLDTQAQDILKSELAFRFTQNDSITQNLSSFKIKVNNQSIVGNVVLSQEPINIPDLYELSEDPSQNPHGAKHDKSWDKKIGYESHSMLTLPIFDLSYQVIGVIQLINRKLDPSKSLKTEIDFKTNICPFDDEDIEYAQIVANQAGIALENLNMRLEISNLFNGFVNASVHAIEQRDPTTSGHSHRVAKLTLETAKLVDGSSAKPFEAVKFNEDAMKEIEYASLLHDFGKLGVRENVLVKAKKLHPWQMDLLKERFELIKAAIEIDYYRTLYEFTKTPQNFPVGFSESSFKNERDQKIEELHEFMQFILQANEPTVLEQAGFDRLKDIANLSFTTIDGASRPYLLDDELKALSISRGSLTREEFAEIQSHVTHTYEFLRKIPWGKKLANVPQIAAKHHEKLDGTGYPNASASIEIPIQSRIMTIADIFDALTASDRPYKKALPVEKALDILGYEVKAHKLDRDVFDLFIETKIYNIIIDN